MLHARSFSLSVLSALPLASETVEIRAVTRHRVEGVPLAWTSALPSYVLAEFAVGHSAFGVLDTSAIQKKGSENYDNTYDNPVLLGVVRGLLERMCVYRVYTRLNA